jgi:hypothetical protein
MFFRRFFRFALVAILLFGLFGMLSSAAYRSGWSQGYVSGQTADGPAAENVPQAPFSQDIGFHGHGIFSLFWWALAAFFKFWLFIFFIGLIFKFLFWGRHGRHRGRHHGRPFGPWGGGQWGGWHGKWHGHHHHEGGREKGPNFKGQMPPWYDDSDGEPVMKA